MLRPALLLLFSITACQADETLSGYSDADAIWMLTSMMDAPPTSDITITFPQKGKFAGRAPCNRYFGTQNEPLPWFKSGPIASTKMACPALEEERDYFNTLEQVTLAEISETTLILSDDDKVLLTYSRK